MLPGDGVLPQVTTSGHSSNPEPAGPMCLLTLLANPRRRNTRATHTLRRGRKPVLAQCQVLVSRPIAALLGTSPRRKVKIFWGCTSGPSDGRKEGLQTCNGSVNPLAWRRRGTIIRPRLGE